MKQKIYDFKKNKINLFSQERLKSYSLQEDKKDIEIQLKRHNNNLNLIQRITKDLALIEIGTRNLLDFYMKEKYKNDDWINQEAQNSSEFKIIIDKIKKRYGNLILNNNQLLSNLTIGQITKIIREKDALNIIFDFKNINLKKYYFKNKNRYKNRRPISKKHKADIILSLLVNIRNRSFHWENLTKLRDDGIPRLSVENKGIYTTIEPDKIETFLKDILNEIYKE
ncbi:hypothetical protein [Campylobacter ureolyticus]|uniref:hypothetical protein n=1 Tax=Campylobacter ureolyticus TaxID=827 RepID=UPI00046AA120|nr:hypothetical protein [Campylobacter ureolyticus]